jgi:hypothetical protein
MRVKLAPLGPSLISRTRGEAIRHDVLAMAGGAPVIVLDFHGVRRASYSFVDELVGELSTMSKAGVLPAHIEIEGADDTIGFHVDECLSRRFVGPAAAHGLSQSAHVAHPSL